MELTSKRLVALAVAAVVSVSAAACGDDDTADEIRDQVESSADELQQESEELRKEIEEGTKTSREDLERQAEELRREAEKAEKNLQGDAEELRKEAEELQKELGAGAVTPAMPAASAPVSRAARSSARARQRALGHRPVQLDAEGQAGCPETGDSTGFGAQQQGGRSDGRQSGRHQLPAARRQAGEGRDDQHGRDDDCHGQVSLQSPSGWRPAKPRAERISSLQRLPVTLRADVSKRRPATIM